MISLPFSDRRSPDTLLKGILAASREAVVAVAPDGRVAEANPRFLELAGWTGPAEGRTLDELVAHWARRAAHPRVLEAYFRTCSEHPASEAPLELQPNPGQIIEARCRTLPGTDGTRYRVWFFQEWRTSALAWVSHEIKNPLNAVLGFSELLAEGLAGSPVSPPVKESLRGLRTSAKHLHTVLGDLLDLSRLEAGAVEIHPEWVSLTAFLEDLDALFATRFQRRGIAFRVHSPEGAPVELWTDPGRLSQVLGNLLSNALRYTKQGWVTLRAARAGAGWEFSVEDTGIGIPADQQATIFEPFVQTQGQEGRQPGGTGLGLAICRTLAQSLGGRMGLDSDPRTGSRFTVTFAALPSRLESAAAAPLPAPPLPPTTLLLADDERSNHLLIQGFLRNSPVTILSAGDGREALELWERHRPPVVLLDLRMPGLSGVETARRIRTLDAAGSSRLLAMSATRPRDSQDEEDPGLWSGFLEKPFGKRDFLNFLANHVTFVDELTSSP